MPDYEYEYEEEEEEEEDEEDEGYIESLLSEELLRFTVFYQNDLERFQQNPHPNPDRNIEEFLLYATDRLRRICQHDGLMPYMVMSRILYMAHELGGTGLVERTAKLISDQQSADWADDKYVCYACTGKVLSLLTEIVPEPKIFLKKIMSSFEDEAEKFVRELLEQKKIERKEVNRA